MSHTALGTHCILELYGCPFEILNDEQHVKNAIVEASQEAMSTLLNISTHSFDPHGVTALGLLAESHISVHTWPELGYAAVDIFTCGQTAKPRQACQMMGKRLGAESQYLRVLPRGGRFAAPLTLLAGAADREVRPCMAAR